MSKIFISWSKNKSEELAKLTKHTLEELLPDTNFFMSEEDIQAGDCVQNTIMHQIEQCDIFILCFATVYKGNIIKNLIMDCQSYTKYRPNETTGGIFVSWRRKEELPTGA